MNKSIKYLFVTALAVSTTGLSAYTGHTYLARRSHNVNLPMELTTFYERTQLKLDGRFGGNLQISGFYGETNGDVGNYFYPICGTSCPTTCPTTCPVGGCTTTCNPCCKNGYTLARGAAAACPSTAKDFDLGYILHKLDGATTDPKATVAYDPQQTSWGFRFDYYQNMDKILKGLYLKLNTTFVDVKNCMNLCVSSDDTTLKDRLIKLFSGQDVNVTGDTHNLQAKLTKGLMGGSACSCGDCHSASGIADIDIILGYKFLYKEKYHFGINLGITIPTGNDPDGNVMFEPIYGNHGHFGFGGGLDAHANLWSKDEQNIKLNFAANYRYLFEASENRPLKLKCYCSPYVLLGKVGAVADTPLIPAVNVLSQYGVDVTPGSQFDGILALAYNNGGFSFDLGYNLYYREDEDVNVKDNCGCATDATAKYRVAARSFDTHNVFGHDIGDYDCGSKADITKCDIDVDAASTPSQCTNGIYGGLGYHFKKWDYPLLMGIGGKYDWACKNSEFDSWSIWAKLALSF